MRYYVDNSSYFDTLPYSKPSFAKAVKDGGGKNIRLSLKYGWRNQPQVVTFSSGPAVATRVGIAVKDALKTPWIILRVKDW